MKLTFEIEECGSGNGPCCALAIGNWMDPEVDSYDIDCTYIHTLEDAEKLQAILAEFIKRKKRGDKKWQ